MGISPSTSSWLSIFLIVKSGFRPMNDHRLHRSPCSTDSSKNPGWSPTIRSKADTGVMRSATSSFQTGMTVCSFACSMNCSSDDCILKVKSCRSLIESFSCYGMNISFTKNYVIISSNFDFIPIFWVKQNLVTDFHCSNIWASGFYFGPS